MLRLIGAATIATGAAIALASFLVGNASGPGIAIATIQGKSLVSSWAVTLGDLTFSAFWVGIAITIPGIAAVLSFPQHKRHGTARMERELGRQILKERATESDS